MLDKVQDQIKELANENPTSKEVFKALGRRTRAREATNLNWFKYFLTSGGITNIASDEFMATFKKLHALGIGTLINSKKDKNGQVKPARFIWNYNLKDVARAASGQLVSDTLRKVEVKAKVDKEVAPLEQAKPIEVVPVAAPVASQSANTISINRDGLSVNIELPKDIKPQELMAWLSLAKDLNK